MATFTVSELAKLVDATIHGDANSIITGVGAIDTASSGEITFMIGGKYRRYLNQTNASAVLLTSDFSKDCPTTSLIVSNPELAFAKIAKLFLHSMPKKIGIHKTAVIGEHAQIHSSATIHANCVIGDNVIIGENTIIKAGTVLGDNISIGNDCVIHSNVTFYDNVKIANRVVIESGVVIGADGFGYVNNQGRWEKIPQLGKVIIEDDVEIGANTCIDCGALQDTMIHRGVKVDDLVMIAHNVEIGDDTIIAGATAIAGSVKIGKNCIIGGDCKFKDHVQLCDNVILTGGSSVKKDIAQPGIFSSCLTVLPKNEWYRMVSRLKQLDTFAKQLSQLERAYNDRNKS